MIYFCIPTYNEERTVGVVLWKLRQVMSELRRDYQIIVVDDASTDSTPAVLKPYIRVLPLTVIRNAKRRGYSDSLEIAVREAVKRSPYPKRDTVITLQADFTEDPDVAPLMIKRIEAGADIVSCDVEIEEASSRSFRWGRKLFRWLLRKHEWATSGDPVSGLRAYRVMVLKRAIETRGNSRLLSWKSYGANVELMMQAAPHSRRNEVVETQLKMHRHQRDSRYAFMDVLSQVRGAASGRAAKNVSALPTDSHVVAAELEKKPARRDGERSTRGRDGERTRGRDGGKTRRERPARPQREKPQREQREKQPVLELKDETPPPSADAPRKKRRPRRRKKKATQNPNTQMELVVHTNEEPVVIEPSMDASGEQPAGEEGLIKKKKSRRGRRGGRGRRRGPRPGAQSDTPSEAPPDIAAEG